MEMFTPSNLEKCECECHLREELLNAERYNKKAHILHVTTKEEIDFLSQHKEISHLKLLSIYIFRQIVITNSNLCSNEPLEINLIMVICG